ncbi:MAG: DUF4212 domain-containing protein [Betaproteobacteria bacterium AqS2]|uniref:DUF4212 domain-containing protein n=1 Tax=Candidatus Amphirhobacter heronislandensis TaxID=1732024 RepID=A0A930XY54_9GAMM|nr:DUF4212 domain-containing protein [Betaproteobacteria bacterium AqS2]
MDNQENGALAAYWRDNLRLIYICLGIWFAVSYLFGILLVDQLNTINLYGYKLGFWFAQQGSIYAFVALIFFYNRAIANIERKHGVEEDAS